jgi:hypothetical protein
VCHGDASKIGGAKVEVHPYGISNVSSILNIFQTVCESMDFSNGSITLHSDFVPSG